MKTHPCALHLHLLYNHFENYTIVMYEDAIGLMTQMHHVLDDIVRMDRCKLKEMHCAYKNDGSTHGVWGHKHENVKAACSCLYPSYSHTCSCHVYVSIMSGTLSSHLYLVFLKIWTMFLYFVVVAKHR